MKKQGLVGALLNTVKVLRRGPALPAPYRTALRHKPTLLGKLAMERWIGLGNAMPLDLKQLAQLRAGSLVGCLW
jgi:hypothetical protein